MRQAVPTLATLVTLVTLVTLTTLAGRSRPAPVPLSLPVPVLKLSFAGVPVSVLAPSLCYIALLVHGAVVVVMVVVVLTVFGPAAVSVAVLVFGREVPGLRGRAQFRAQA